MANAHSKKFQQDLNSMAYAVSVSVLWIHMYTTLHAAIARKYCVLACRHVQAGSWLIYSYTPTKLIKLSYLRRSHGQVWPFIVVKMWCNHPPTMIDTWSSAAASTLSVEIFDQLCDKLIMNMVACVLMCLWIQLQSYIIDCPVCRAVHALALPLVLHPFSFITITIPEYKKYIMNNLAKRDYCSYE